MDEQFSQVEIEIIKELSIKVVTWAFGIGRNVCSKLEIVI